MDPSVRLRANLEDLWLSGHESAERAQTLFQDAAHWDPHCEDYARAGASGRLPGNINRDLRSKLLNKKALAHSILCLDKSVGSKEKMSDPHSVPNDAPSRVGGLSLELP